MADAPRTIFQKIWDAHVVAPLGGGNALLYIDRHLLNEVTSPQAFEGLRLAGQRVHRPGATIAVADYNVPTENRHLPIDVVFIGSCTNSRIEDLRSAAAAVADRHVAQGVRAMVVQGSGAIKAQAEAEGLDLLFKAAGFQWREAGCSMCLGMNPDWLKPGERCASTSNRNFEGRQGPCGRTHLMSPAMAAAAVTGHIVHVRTLR